MALWDWFLGLFDKESNTLQLDMCIGELAEEVFYKELAINSAINLISKTISNAEFLTYEQDEEIKSDIYYLLNVEPNQNKNANKFWRDVVYKLVYENECLIIQNNDMFYVAESFTVKRFALKENIYSDVIVEGYKLREIFTESKVLYLELHNADMKKIIDQLYSSYGKLIKASKNFNMRKKSRRGTLKIPGSYPQTDEAQRELQELLNERFKTYFEAETGAVLPLQNGLEFDEQEDKMSNNPSQEGRDLRYLIDDVFDFVAIALNIPPQLLKGDVADTDKAFTNFITFCINPLTDLITEEINRKYYGKELFLQGTYTKLDTTNVKHVDIEDVANALDMLLRIGTNTINDNLKTLGRKTINEPWANTRFMTKNYDTIESFLKGGD